MFTARRTVPGPPAPPPSLATAVRTRRTRALIALTAAGLLWGTSTPLSKAAFAGFGPAWLTVLRFAVAALVMLAVVRPSLRRVRPALWGYGAVGYGGCVLLQNLGLERTSVTHAALLLGAVPVLVAGLAVVVDGARLTRTAWVGLALSLTGIVAVAGAGGGGATAVGDLLVLGSVLIGAVFTIAQARLLPGQDVIAATCAQFLASAVAAVPFALLTEPLPIPGSDGPDGAALLAGLSLAVLGTVLPFTLFAYGQTGVEPHVAGVFLNLETLVATGLAVLVLGEHLGAVQVLGGLALLTGIYLGTVRRSGAVGLEPAELEPAELEPAGLGSELFEPAWSDGPPARSRSAGRALRTGPVIEIPPPSRSSDLLEIAGEPQFARAA